MENELLNRKNITPFWKMLLVLGIFLFLPFLIIWLLWGWEFNLLKVDEKIVNRVDYNIYIFVGIFIFTFIFIFLFYITKIVKADLFAFAFTFYWIFFTVVWTGKLNWTGSYWILRFFVVILVGIVSLLIGTFFTWFAINLEFKNEEKKQNLINQYNENREKLTDKQKLKAENLIKFIAKKQEKEKLKNELRNMEANLLNEKISSQLNKNKKEND